MENLYTRLRQAEPTDGRNEDAKVFPSSNGPVEMGGKCADNVFSPRAREAQAAETSRASFHPQLEDMWQEVANDPEAMAIYRDAVKKAYEAGSTPLPPEGEA